MSSKESTLLEFNTSDPSQIRSLEYESLRAEILEHFSKIWQIFLYSLSGIVAITAFSLGSKNSENIWGIFLSFCLIIPAVSIQIISHQYKEIYIKAFYIKQAYESHSSHAVYWHTYNECLSGELKHRGADFESIKHILALTSFGSVIVFIIKIAFISAQSSTFNGWYSPQMILYYTNIIFAFMTIYSFSKANLYDEKTISKAHDAIYKKN